MLYLKTFLGIIFQVTLFGLFLLLPAPNWFWSDAIVWMVFYFLLNLITSFWICAYYPESMEARLESNFKKQPKNDKIATAIIVTGIALALNMIAVDVFYLNIFEPLKEGSNLFGLAVFILGYVFILLTMIQNEFAQSVVNIQDERNQILVDTGLYSFVRHPMYMGFMFFFSGIAFWLGSLFMATVGTLLLMCAFIPRMIIEEQTLANELEGYDNYLKRVKYRLLPKIF